MRSDRPAHRGLALRGLVLRELVLRGLVLRGRARPRRRLLPALACAFAAGALSVATVGTAPADAAPHTVASFSVDSDPWAFLASGHTGNATLRWNPCSPIRYAVNTAGAPRGFVAEARRAVTELAHASGLKFAYEGKTATRPQLIGDATLSTNPMSASRLNLVIAWDVRSSPNSLLSLQSGEAGETMRVASGGESIRAGKVAVSPTQYHFAAIVLDHSSVRSLVANDKRGNGLYHLLLHELGHAVGLNHVSDSGQIMYPIGSPDSPVHYGAGDAAGLKAIGFSAGCM